MKDEAVSELLGYAILAGVVMIAAIGISAGAGDLISSCARNAGLSEAASSVGTFSRIASQSVASGNEYPEAFEMVVPQGYELVLLDGGDDWRTISIDSGGSELASLRPGSMGLRSAFRTVAFESGGVFVNDSGSSSTDQEPSIFVAGKTGSRVSLYMCVPCLSADTTVVPPGKSTVLSLQCKLVRDYEWQVLPGQQITVKIRTDSQNEWKQVLERQGFTVTVRDQTVTGSRGGIDDVRLTSAELQVGKLR